MTICRHATVISNEWLWQIERIECPWPKWMPKSLFFVDERRTMMFVGMRQQKESRVDFRWIVAGYWSWMHFAGNGLISKGSVCVLWFTLSTSWDWIIWWCDMRIITLLWLGILIWRNPGLYWDWSKLLKNYMIRVFFKINK